MFTQGERWCWRRFATPMNSMLYYAITHCRRSRWRQELFAMRLQMTAISQPHPIDVPNEPLLPPDPDKVPCRPQPVAPPAPSIHRSYHRRSSCRWSRCPHGCNPPRCTPCHAVKNRPISDICRQAKTPGQPYRRKLGKARGVILIVRRRK